METFSSGSFIPVQNHSLAGKLQWPFMVEFLCLHSCQLPMHLAPALSFLFFLQAPNYCCKIILLFGIYDACTFQSSSIRCFGCCFYAYGNIPSSQFTDLRGTDSSGDVQGARDCIHICPLVGQGSRVNYVKGTVF